MESIISIIERSSIQKYRAVLDTNISEISNDNIKLFNEWKDLNVIKNDTSLTETGIQMLSIDKNIFSVKPLNIQTLLAFLTSVGSEVITVLLTDD